MLENDELKDELIIDEEEAKRQFLEELRNKNNEIDLKEKKQDEKNNITSDKAEEEISAVKDKDDEEDSNIENEKVEEDAKEEESREIVESNKEIVEEAKEEVNEEKNEIVKKVKSPLSVKKFKANLIDTVIASLLSVVGLYLFDFILRLFGYYVVDLEGVYIIVFLIILILYPTVMQNLKLGRTFGQNISKIQVQEGEE